MDHVWGRFIWDANKELLNIRKHGIDFREATKVFLDPHRKIFVDSGHSDHEPRHFCIGKTSEGRVMTVRFVYRHERIRIFGAGYWRKGASYYEKED